MRGRSLLSTVSVMFLLFSLASLTSPTAARAGGPPNPIYVDATATGANSGETWEDAKTNLQDALAMAVTGVAIWVAEGTYMPGIDVTTSFPLKPGVALYGGFPTGGSTFEERDPSLYPTTLSGDVGVPGVSTDNSYHVVTGIDLDTALEQATLDGFTIEDGYASGTYPGNCGGGMLLLNSSPILSNLTFEGNYASSSGGGLYNYHSHPIMELVEFRGNEAVLYGGGLANYESDPNLMDVRFYDNHASYGGGIDNYYSSPYLYSLYMQGNTATVNGGGINNESSAPLVDASYVQYNTADADGGGMYNVDSTSTVTRSNFYRNDAVGWGGGMANLRSAATIRDVGFTANTALYGGGFSCEDPHATEEYPVLVDVTFEWNEGTNGSSSNGYGGGAYLHECDAAMTNVRFEGNRAALGGGGMEANNSSHPVMANAIFAANEASWGGGLYVGWQSSTSLLSSTVAGNVADDATNGGGGILVLQGDLVMHNTILWGNSAPTGANLKFDEYSGVEVAYSVLEGGCPAGAKCEELITENPQVVRLPDASTDDNGDLRLTGASPAIDAGNAKLLPADVHDLDDDGDASESLPLDIAGSPRVYDRLDVTDTGEGHVDIGVFEAPPTRLYVDEKSTGASTGLDWANAFADLQTALIWGASGPITIWVAEGTYTPGDLTSDSFQLQSEVALYGGFPAGGGSGDFDARDPDRYKSILSGDIGVTGESGDNVRSVVTSPSVDATAVLDGFTITDGYGGTGGGGWYNFYGDPTIRNVRFVRNRAASGGGMRSNQGSPTLTNVWFLGNVATEDGGGYLGYGAQSEATFTNVVFCGNLAQNRGGGLTSDTGGESLVNVTFASNTATYGGGVAATDAHVTVDNAVFWGNGGAWGSQIWSQDLKVEVTYSLIAAACPETYATCSGNLVTADPLFDHDPSPGGDGTWGSADDDYGALGISALSPAADAGDNDAVPEDVQDLDADGNVTEKLPVDIARHPRFIDSPSAPDTGNGMAPLVDMGAHEALIGTYLPLILRNY